jgi:hypothetical protein
MKRFVAVVAVVAALAALLGLPAPAGVFTPSTGVREAVTAPQPAATDSRPLVLVLDGAGGRHGCSQALSQVNVLLGNPVELAVFPWSHGSGRLLLDQVDAAHARMQGARLAEMIVERSKREPGRRVAIVAHSAGAGVTLAACDVLPRDGIDRVVFLAPSVSSRYDLRASLIAAREGVDVFYSRKDWLALGVATRLVGMTDRRWAPAAGRWGFRAPTCESEKLRQYCWTRDLAWTGNTGGHYGTHSLIFLQVYVFPLLVGTN